MNIRKLDNEEYNKAKLLSLAVFTKCGTTDFNANGLETFKKFIYNKELMDQLTIWGAFDNNELIGIIGTKLNGTHISLFFINPDYHRKGIGRELFTHAYANQIVEKITVNSSSYAAKFYENLGFSKTAEEQETDGLKYTPMIKTQNKLWHRAICEADLSEICKMPQNAEELFFMFPKANYPLTVEELGAGIMERWDSTVVLLQDKIVGFANFYKLEKNKYCSIGNVIISPRFRSQGAATFLITTMEKIGKEKYNVSEIHLSCFDANTKGLLLYTKLKYKPYEIEKYISKGNKISALIKMRKVLNMWKTDVSELTDK